MPIALRLAASLSRRLRIAALTLIALFALKVGVAATAPPVQPAASAVITPSAAASGAETLERME